MTQPNNKLEVKVAAGELKLLSWHWRLKDRSLIAGKDLEHRPLSHSTKN